MRFGAFVFWMIPLWLFADAHIFVYHRFGDDRYPSTSISIEQLRNDFDYLKENGYKVITLSTLTKALKEKTPIDDKWVVLTIDDGYRSFYQNGLDLFKEYNYPFALFVYTKASKEGYGDFMRTSELLEAAKYGELALHTHSHPHLTSLSTKQVADDIQKGIDYFKSSLGFAPKFFAYPYGEFDLEVKKVAKGFPFEAILNQNMGAIGAQSDIYSLDRCAITQGDSIKNYLRINYLHATWQSPLSYPKDNTIKSIEVKTNSNKKNAKLYISSFGWQSVVLQDGALKLDKEFTLSKERTRLILKIDDAINNHLIVKQKENN